MNNAFFQQKLKKTGNLTADLVMRQYILDKVAKFMEVKSINLKLTQSEIAS